LPIFSLMEALTILLVYSGTVNSSLAVITATITASKEPHLNPNKRYFAVSLLGYLIY
jgi:predicted benzoate:H+ symporter BenE